MMAQDPSALHIPAPMEFAAVHHLGLKGKEEILSLRTIRHDKAQVKGATVLLKVSPLMTKGVKHDKKHAFTAAELDIAEQS